MTKYSKIAGNLTSSLKLEYWRKNIIQRHLVIREKARKTLRA
jgi:hypothetical protein